MLRRTFAQGALALGVAAPAVVRAQAWPSKQLRMVIPYPPAGPSDISTRIVMEKASQILGQSVLFDNKAGASGMIGGEAVKNSPVDHHTFLTTTTAMVCITRHLQPIPFDPDKDFIPVSLMTTSWSALAVHPSVPAKTLKEFVEYAKANPGKVNFGSAGLATITHLYGEMLNLEAGIKMVHVPYRGSAPATNALVAGEIQAQFDPTVLPQVKAGKLRALAMLANGRHPDFPDVPTLREQGYGKEGGDAWFGILAPAGTSPDAIARLDKAIAEAMKAPDVIDKLHQAALKVTHLDPAAFKAQIDLETKAFGDVIKRGNIKVQ